VGVRKTFRNSAGRRRSIRNNIWAQRAPRRCTRRLIYVAPRLRFPRSEKQTSANSTTNTPFNYYNMARAPYVFSAELKFFLVPSLRFLCSTMVPSPRADERRSVQTQFVSSRNLMLYRIICSYETAVPTFVCTAEINTTM